MGRPPALLVLLASLVPLVSLACTEQIPVGTVGFQCPNDNNCRPGLKCIDGRCATPPPDAGAPPRDAGAPDAAPDDAGVDPPDAGEDAGVDAGPICPVPPELGAIQTRIFGADGQPSCDEAACHGQAAAGGLQLTLPLDQLRIELLGDTQTINAPEAKIVVPGDPAESRLYVVISTLAPGGNGGPMPPVRPLDPCDVETVRKWIEDGAQ